MFADLEHDAMWSRITDAEAMDAERERLTAEFRSQRLDALPRGFGFQDMHDRQRRQPSLLDQINASFTKAERARAARNNPRPAMSVPSQENDGMMSLVSNNVNDWRHVHQ